MGALAYLVLFVVVLVRGARRWRDSTPFERVQLTPVYVFALSTFLLVTIARGLDSDAAWWAALISTGLMPFAFLGGLMRSEIVSLDASLQESLEELRASRARIVEAGDAERRRLERDLHDGAQSRLVALSLLLKVARKKADGDVADLLDQASDELATSLAELRELARGIHPAVLTDRGLEPALRTLADRAPVPVEIRAEIPERLPGSVESAAYFVASEALTNVAKYSQATEASVIVERHQRPREGRGLRRRDRRRGRDPRLRAARALRPRGGARRDAVGGEPSGARDPAARRDPGQRPVALLELLARPAPARVVAAELLVLVDAALLHRRGRTGSSLAARRRRRSAGPRTCRPSTRARRGALTACCCCGDPVLALDLDLDVVDHPREVRPDGVHQVLEERERLVLVGDDRLDLGEPAQVDALAQVVHVVAGARASAGR